MHPSTQATPHTAPAVPFFPWPGTPAPADPAAVRSSRRWLTRYADLIAQQWDHVAACELADLHVTQPKGLQ